MAKAYESKIKGLFENEEFVAKFKALEDLEKVGELFKEYGVELTEEELVDFVKSPAEASKSGEAKELSADDLESVSGGVWWGIKAVGAAWGAAVDYWGSPGRAVERTASFWYKAATGDKNVWKGVW